MLRQDGKPFWTHLAATVALNHAIHLRPAADGSPVFRTVLIDVSERKSAEEERLRLNWQLHQSEKLNALGAIAMGVAKVCRVKATVWERMSVETISIIGMILSFSGVGIIVFSKRRKLIEGGRQSTTIEHPWIFAGGILLTILGVLAQVVVAYF
jgi:hypothetical protein